MCYETIARWAIVKEGSGVPTVPSSPSHNDGSWIETDIYEGELYLDTVTQYIYTRVGSSIVNITTGRKSSNLTSLTVDDEDNAVTAPYITSIRATDSMRILTVETLNSEPLATLKVNGVAYVLGANINKGDLIEVEHSTNGVSKLNIQLL